MNPLKRFFENLISFLRRTARTLLVCYCAFTAAFPAYAENYLMLQMKDSGGTGIATNELKLDVYKSGDPNQTAKQNDKIHTLRAGSRIYLSENMILERANRGDRNAQQLLDILKRPNLTQKDVIQAVATLAGNPRPITDPNGRPKTWKDASGNDQNIWMMVPVKACDQNSSGKWECVDGQVPLHELALKNCEKCGKSQNVFEPKIFLNSTEWIHAYEGTPMYEDQKDLRSPARATSETAARRLDTGPGTAITHCSLAGHESDPQVQRLIQSVDPVLREIELLKEAVYLKGPQRTTNLLKGTSAEVVSRAEIDQSGVLDDAPNEYDSYRLAINRYIKNFNNSAYSKCRDDDGNALDFEKFKNDVIIPRSKQNNIPPEVMLTTLTLETPGKCDVWSNNHTSFGLAQINLKDKTWEFVQRKFREKQARGELSDYPEACTKPITQKSHGPGWRAIREANAVACLKNPARAFEAGIEVYLGKINYRAGELPDLEGRDWETISPTERDVFRLGLADYNGGEGRGNQMKKQLDQLNTEYGLTDAVRLHSGKFADLKYGATAGLLTSNTNQDQLGTLIRTGSGKSTRYVPYCNVKSNQGERVCIMANMLAYAEAGLGSEGNKRGYVYEWRKMVNLDPYDGRTFTPPRDSAQ